ncbi:MULTISPECIES: TrkA family potassium uptake protein [unclassified Polaribacter]|jgi:trk system potassium uptake protein TrkA|uniref:potassium channel family protein n=1 Tax=unclassified Polaribacter TaxID=196858 RepID=UPI001C4E5153|nr:MULTISPECIES: TrkA family potassium uptake protein [unclassified Polaribacter]QXP62321.1 TrkA family potassium uptake protein [Polaribacter sp. HaHaR_3_91]QXP68076.1 TrkA family potassium uptake protein [Polaribacter sp. AHE13PA]QXP70247.1 TrkA family potassium uptake protein [Polaribacter sp. R2A056_3_33]
MKYIIVGLGNFGGPLAEKLTTQGNEVIGIDSNMAKVELYKERISHTICMDATDESTVSGLPLSDTDVVIIAFGQDQGANVMTTALFKNFQVKRLISRAINPLHEKVLNAIGIEEIVHPEEESAERWAKKLCLTNVVDSFELSADYSIIEVNIPERYIGSTIKEIQLRRKYNILALTTIKKTKVKSLVGKSRNEEQVQGVIAPNTVLNENDILVIYGANKDLRKFTNK